MTFPRFLVLWALTSVGAAIFIGRAIAMGRRVDDRPCHLLTARQAAAELGVSVAAVQAWQRDGLLPARYCPACGRASISIDDLRPPVAPEEPAADLSAGVLAFAGRS